MRFHFLRLTRSKKPQGVSRPFQLKKALEGHSWTLVELLLVIAIISVLVALILPVLSVAHHKARKTVCEVQRNAITRYDEQTGMRLDVPVPVLEKCYECHIPNRYRQP